MRLSVQRQKGFTLVETMIAITIFVCAMLGILLALQMAMVSSIKSREQIAAGRLMNMAFTKFKSIDYYRLYAVDSSKTNYNLTGTFQGSSTYPYSTALAQIHTAARAAGFSHFTTELTFMRRDSSDANANGYTSDLIAFTDANNNLIDDYDATIRYNNQNSDSDYYDTYTSGGRTVSEQPDTHLKEVTVKIWKQGRVVAQQSELISLEQYSGIESAASGAILRLFISQPPNDSYLYNLNTSARATAFGLTLVKSFPSDNISYRADTSNPLLLSGETDPVAVVHFYVNGTSPERNSTTADSVGLFSISASATTLVLVEGKNRIWARATKDTNLSPWTVRDVVLDLNPPSVTSMQPSGTVHDRAPRVSAILADTGVSTDVVSGICSQVVTLKQGTTIVSHVYNPTTGEVVWVDSTTMTPVILSTGSYAMTLEGADNAHYKVRQSWNFAITITDPDTSAPAITNQSPTGVCTTTLPDIQVRVTDSESGIDPTRIELRLDGVVIVDASNVGEYYNAGTGYITYTPSVPLDNGTSHTVDVSASHWATAPAGNITATNTWNFVVSVP